MFPPDADPPSVEEIRAVMEQGIADGLLEAVDEGGERKYRLTEGGVKHVEETVFVQLGVAPEEGLAWMSERMEGR